MYMYIWLWLRDTIMLSKMYMYMYYVSWCGTVGWFCWVDDIMRVCLVFDTFSMCTFPWSLKIINIYQLLYYQIPILYYMNLVLYWLYCIMDPVLYWLYCIMDPVFIILYYIYGVSKKLIMFNKLLKHLHKWT